MNARYLILILFILGLTAYAISTRSTLTQERGADHVFYGAAQNHFLGEELAIGDFNGDDLDDVVSTILWDDPAAGGWTFQTISECPGQWPGVVRMTKDQDTIRVCYFGDPVQDTPQQAAWVTDGWAIIDTISPCSDCLNALWIREDQGAAVVIMGGDWSGKGHDIDLALGLQDYFIAADDAGASIYNGFAAGDIDNNGADELALGAPGLGAGSVFVVRDSATTFWPDTIRVPSSSLNTHEFSGRRNGDSFGKGVLVEDLDGNGRAEVIVSAPHYDGIDSTLTSSGAIYIFYSNGNLPATVNLQALSDEEAETNDYLQIIVGADSSQVGVTGLQEHHDDGHTGGHYEPVGLAVGDWDGDGNKDLVIGAGQASGGNGKVYVIFGRATGSKLRPGNTIDLANTPSDSMNAPDVRFDGGNNSRLGAGVALIDADDEGSGGKDDLVLGAPYKHVGGSTGAWEYFGEANIVWGNSQTVLLNDRIRDTTEVDVSIKGANFDDQLGGHFDGNRDIDNDGKNDIGIAGQDIAVVIFGGQAATAWPSTIDLATVTEDEPAFRVLQWTTTPPPSSVSIKFADLDGDNYHDLVFGGYDNPSYPGVYVGGFSDHAGWMWVTKGADMWKSGQVNTQTWSGNIFVNGDINIPAGQTLTIAPGTDVWIWPRDPDPSDDNPGAGYPYHEDSTRVEFRVWGTLNVNGTAADSVRFLAWDMESTVTNDPYKWWGIIVHSGGEADINYAQIRNGSLAPGTGITVKNSLIEHADVGLSMGSGSAADSVYLENVTIRNCASMGVRIQDGMKLKLKNCVMENVGDYGVRAFDGASVYVEETTIEDALIEAVSVTGSGTFGEIDSCTFQNNYRGLRVEDDASATIDGSTLDQSDNFGIYTLYDGALTISDCTIKNGDAGVASFESDPTILGSTIRDNDVGILALQGANTVVQGCDILYNDTGVLATGGGNPNLGDVTGGGSYGNNNLRFNTTYHLSNTNTGITVKAENNYWEDQKTKPPLVCTCLPLPSKVNGLMSVCPALCSEAYVVTLDTAELPRKYALSQSYPNPFNPVTTIPFAVPEPGGHVSITIYNVRGQLVRTLVDETRVPGYHTVIWDGTNNQRNSTSTGVYFVLMRAKAFRETRKLVLLK